MLGKKGRSIIDQRPYNGWPNVFTWQMYTCLSSYSETYNVARRLVSSAPSSFAAEDALREWVRENVDEWFDLCPDEAFKVLITGLVQNALHQVDWSHLAHAFDESSE